MKEYRFLPSKGLQNLRLSGRAKGFAILTMTSIFLIFSSGLLITAHFLGERVKAMQRLHRVEERLHKLHREDHRGKRKFWPTFDKPDSRKPEVTRRKEIARHNIHIDFGGK